MNFKMTLSLAFLLIILVLGLYIVRSSPRATETDLAPTPPTAGTTHNLIEDDALGEVVKVTCRQPGQDQWVFEKLEPEAGGDAVWHMTAPLEFKAVSWEVDKFDRQLGSLKYEISYEPGEAGAVTAADAGLDPPQAEVTLTDAQDESVTVEIGKQASQRTTYVRLAGTERICVGQATLRNLFKSDPIEYRNRELIRFQVEDATRLEITAQSTAGSPETFTFTSDGDRWMMETPVTARVTEKVADAVRALSSLNAVGWVADVPDRLSVYGLETPELTVQVTVEKTIVPEPDPDEAAADEEEAAAPPEPETVIETFVLHVSDLAPIGEDTKRFARIGEETSVATIMKTTVDKFQPDMSEWRDMRVTASNVNAATRVELATPTHSTVFVKENGEWRVEGKEATAQAAAVTELLDAVRDLEAVDFVEPDPDELAAMGFDQPQVDIRLTVPGVEGVERITVGGFVAPETEEQVYVRYNEAASVAKVPAEDVARLLRDPGSYLDHTRLHPPGRNLTRLALSSPKPGTGTELRAGSGSNKRSNSRTFTASPTTPSAPSP